jgi:uncharacterized protein (DUF885 family)
VAITDELCRSFLDLWWHFDPAAATLAGAPGQDSRLGGFDPDAVRSYAAALRSIAGAAEDLEVDELADEIDRTALLDHLRVLLFRLEEEHPHRTDPVFWISHACSAFDGLLLRAPSDPASATAALDRLRELPRFLTEARDTLRDPPQVLVDAAVAMLPGLSVLLDETATRFAPLWAAFDEDDSDTIVAAAESAVGRTSQALRSEIAASPAPGAEAVGEDEVDRRLHHEHASVHNGAEVWRSANRLVTETEAEVAALAAVIDPGRGWREVYEALAGGEADAATAWRESLAESWGAAEAAGFGAVAPAPLEVTPAPGYVRVLEPEASYRQSDGRSPARVLVSGSTPALVPWLAARLGPPGVHLHRSRCDGLTRLVRRHLSTSSTALGWSLYAQELVRDHGLRPDPESRLAERVLLLRDAHLAVVDLGIHTRQFTADDAIGYLTAHLPVERGTAQAEVWRVACRPTSAAAAILGKRELLRLRDDVREARGSSFTLDGFHEEVFGYGGIPVPLIRWGMGLDD